MVQKCSFLFYNSYVTKSYHFLQIMYMYYLLGHRLMELPISVERKEVMAENTYLLTLDGDIDFQPNAVQLLVDLMKKNRNLGAACGRIHPVGSGNLSPEGCTSKNEKLYPLNW